MKLARVVPNLLSDYREGELSLEQLEAFNISDDHKKQFAIYKSLNGWDEPSDIRDALTEKMVNTTDPLSQLVGLDAYHAAGGKSRADLFGEDVYLENQDIVKKLAAEKLEGTKPAATAPSCRI